MSLETIAILLFLLIFIVLMTGYPVAIVLGGLSTIIGLIFVPEFLDFLPLRFMGVVQNYVLLAVPLFVFMGLVLEKSGIAEDLLFSMGVLFGSIRGGLAYSVVIVGVMLAASTGIVGATVISMGLISMPIMLKKGYSASVSAGVICSSGTLGQIIPPSVVLVLLGSVLNVSIGDIFKAAVLPGILIVIFYLLYIYIYALIFPDKMPALPPDEIKAYKSEHYTNKILISFLYPMCLILLVLGAIFTGAASPTEAAAIGAMGSLILAYVKRASFFQLIKEVSEETMHIVSMVFLILLGATTFSMTFRGLGGDKWLTDWIIESGWTSSEIILLVMLLVFIAGFFIDFIEIIFIIVPVVLPIFVELKIDLIWIGILIAVNLQTSFLTPPFGFALFYLKGVAPQEVKTIDIYKGVIPFIGIQLLMLVIIFTWPQILNLL